MAQKNKGHAERLDPGYRIMEKKKKEKPLQEDRLGQILKALKSLKWLNTDTKLERPKFACLGFPQCDAS
jgi:hypothetical protein